MMGVIEWTIRKLLPRKPPVERPEDLLDQDLANRTDNLFSRLLIESSHLIMAGSALQERMSIEVLDEVRRPKR